MRGLAARGRRHRATLAIDPISLTGRLTLPTAACPCNPAIAYADCCGPLHAGTARAATAEALMRSRYSAYALGDAAYLRTTWHASTRPTTLDLDDGAVTRWLGLTVKHHEITAPNAAGRDTATVEFVARCKTGGAPALRLHEVSRGVQLQRITWTPAADGSVTQQWDVSDDQGASWQVSFRGVYRRAPAPPVAVP